MRTFRLHKLVRSKLPQVYKSLDQVITGMVLPRDKHISALIVKAQEESKELAGAKSTEEIIKEVIDLQQIIKDLAELLELPVAELERRRSEKEAKSGNFLSGDFIETITLKDNDEWVDYYVRNGYEEIHGDDT